jgi:hypothetical protein
MFSDWHHAFAYSSSFKLFIFALYVFQGALSADGIWVSGYNQRGIGSVVSVKILETSVC